MTYVIGLKSIYGNKNALVIAADRREMTGYYKSQTCKILNLSPFPILFTGSGKLSDIQFLKKLLPDELKEYYKTSIFHLDNEFYCFLLKIAKHTKDLESSFLLAASDKKGNISLYHIASGSVEAIEIDQDYMSIGSGKMQGGEILLDILYPHSKDLMNLDHVSEIAIMILSILGTSPYVPSVSAQYDIYTTCLGKVGYLKESSEYKLLENVENKRGIIKKLWLLPEISNKIIHGIEKQQKEKVSKKNIRPKSDRKKVLMIDDEIGPESDLGKKIENFLRSNDIDIIFKKNGKEGLDTALKDKEISLVLLDHIFKGKDQTMQGPEIYLEIKKKRVSLPIVGLSSYKIYKDTFMNLGSMLFIDKSELDEKKDILIELIRESGKGYKYEWIWE